MIKPALVAIGLTLHVSALGLKDNEPPIPIPRPVYHLRIYGFQGYFEVPLKLLRKYHLHNGEAISPMFARVIAQELGYDYTPQLRIILQQIEEKERQP